MPIYRSLSHDLPMESPGSPDAVAPRQPPARQPDPLDGHMASDG